MLDYKAYSKDILYSILNKVSRKEFLKGIPNEP